MNLSFTPQCSSQMFKMLENILSSRFSQFQPHSLIEVLHACMHLERFPLNYMSKVFSPYFLQRLQGMYKLHIVYWERRERKRNFVTSCMHQVFPYFQSAKDSEIHP